jgi:transcriptional regulator of arginine metabolism
MSAKTKRLLTIKDILSTYKIGTQDELLRILEDRGFSLTQATLSRDLKFLKVGRIADPDKGYVYCLPEKQNQFQSENLTSHDNFPVSGFLSLRFSNNFGVIKTKSGYASSIASLIDSSAPYEILGTLAGDDTILLIPIEGASPQDIKKALIVIMPELEDKI